MKVDRFMMVDTQKGHSFVVNVDYVIALRVKSEAEGGGANLYLAEAASDGSRMSLVLDEKETARVQAWLFEQSSN